MKTKILLLFFAVATIALVLAVSASRKLSETRSSLAAHAAQDAALRARIARAEQRLRSAREALALIEQKAAAIATTTQRGNVASSTLANTAPANLGAGKARLSSETILANDPPRMAEYAKHYRDTLALSLGGLFKALRFTPEQVERFTDMRVNQEQRRLELIASAEMQGLDRNSDGYSKLTTKLFQESRKEETEFLGSGALAQEYLDYRAKGGLRDTTRRLGSIEMYPDAPLTAVQVERVTEIIAHNNQRRDEKKPEKWNWQTYGWGWRDGTAIDWETATAQLRGVISPSQLDLVRQFLRPMEAHAGLNVRGAVLRAEAQKISQQPGR